MRTTGTSRRRSWLRGALLTVGVLFLASALLVVVVVVRLPDLEGDGDTREALDRALSTAPVGVAVRISDVIPQPWERLLFVCGYTGQEAVDAVAGFHVEDFVESRQDADTQWLFLQGRTVVTRALPYSPHGDPCAGREPVRPLDWPRADAVFSRRAIDTVAGSDKIYYGLQPVSG